MLLSFPVQYCDVSPWALHGEKTLAVITEPAPSDACLALVQLPRQGVP